MLRENNSRALRVLTIHEATPGHYLQLAWSNRCDSLARSVFGSGVFAEGWAVYVTQVMMDVGYRADDPAQMLAHWKYFLRATTNTLMDIRIHTGTMTEEEAMSLMVDGGFQEESEAREKWSRARLSSTQLCSYFLGSQEMTELEREARRRAGDGFEWRPFLESVISHGTPPMPVIRDILFGEAAGLGVDRQPQQRWPAPRGPLAEHAEQVDVRAVHEHRDRDVLARAGGAAAWCTCSAGRCARSLAGRELREALDAEAVVVAVESEHRAGGVAVEEHVLRHVIVVEGVAPAREVGRRTRSSRRMPRRSSPRPARAGCSDRPRVSMRVEPRPSGSRNLRWSSCSRVDPVRRSTIIPSR